MNRRRFLSTGLEVAAGAALITVGIPSTVFAKGRVKGVYLGAAKAKGATVSLWQVKGKYIAAVKKGKKTTNYSVRVSKSSNKIWEAFSKGASELNISGKTYSVVGNGSTFNVGGAATGTVSAQMDPISGSVAIVGIVAVVAIVAIVAISGGGTVIVKTPLGDVSVTVGAGGNGVMAGPCGGGRTPDGPDGLCGDLR